MSTSMEERQRRTDEAWAAKERFAAQREYLIAESAAPAPTPTESFLAELRSIHAVDPRQAVADLAHDEKTEGYARRSFRKSPHDE